MTPSIPAHNKHLLDALSIFQQLLEVRLQAFFEERPFDFAAYKGRFPHFLGDCNDPLQQMILEYDLHYEEYLILLLALMPHLYPDLLDKSIQDKLPKAGDFPQLGGVRGKHFRGFLPTGETILFLFAGDELPKRMQVQRLFSEEASLARHRILWLEEVPEGEPRMSGKIVLSNDFIDLITTGKHQRPRFGLRFPAQYLETKMEWDDLVLNAGTMQQIRELESWIRHGDTLRYGWGMDRQLKPGYRVLFYGPPGTGKTLTASLLGKYSGKDVYRVDLSMVVSKYIGETEKNLSTLFAKAENKDWILFFDEADALFGKRTNVRDAHDKYANQEVAYLLQRVEQYDGLVILASNFKSNIDEAFLRRFNAIIAFPFPKPAERLALWEKNFPPGASLDPSVDLRELSRRYELTGSNILNIIQFACLEALQRKSNTIMLPMIELGIKRELEKEGKRV